MNHSNDDIVTATKHKMELLWLGVSFCHSKSRPLSLSSSLFVVMKFKNGSPNLSLSTTKLNPKRRPHDQSSNSKTPKLNSCNNFKHLAALLLLFTIVLVPVSVISQSSKKTVVQFFFDASRTKLQLPTIQHPRSSSRQNSTLYFVLEGNEINCGYRYNVVCKFWFFVRCVMLGSYDSIYIVNHSQRALQQLITALRPNDIILFSWRTIEGSNHTKLPGPAELLLKIRQSSNENPHLTSIRIGIFHIANERNRKQFPWYSRVDFVLRNYWIPQPPSHVLYVPLAPQYPHSCTPNTLFPNGTSHHVNDIVLDKSTKNCSCGTMRSARASRRKHLWMFAGSLRRGRLQLVRRLNASSKLKNKGITKVARLFGGDGKIGSQIPDENPKSSYLKLIMESAFVFAPCGNVMETHRILEAVALGAIPVIENCEPHQSQFFPLKHLIIGNGTHGMMGFVESYIDNGKEMDRLQAKLKDWWQIYINELQKNISLTMETVIPQEQRLPI